MKAWNRSPSNLISEMMSIRLAHKNIKDSEITGVMFSVLYTWFGGVCTV